MRRGTVVIFRINIYFSRDVQNQSCIAKIRAGLDNYAPYVYDTYLCILKSDINSDTFTGKIP